MSKNQDKLVYVLGPMRGYEFFNFAAFDGAAKMLREQGYNVVSPAELDRAHGFDPVSLSPWSDWDNLPPSLLLEDVIARDLEAIQKCTAYWALPGWENSIGARAEKAVLDWKKAEWLNDPAKFVPPDDFPRVFRGQGGAPTRETTLPETASERKKFPVASGVLDYFPDAVVAIAQVSWHGNQQHNPGQPLFWNRAKSGDESDAMMRHFLRRGTLDSDGIRHSAKLAWRALALLQKEIENEHNTPYKPE